MGKARTVYRCGGCGFTAPKWAGRCDGCGGWNTLGEVAALPPRPAGVGADDVGRPRPVAEVDARASVARSTGLTELDRVLGGGLVPGSVTLVGGEPGIGKSTLLLQAAAAMAAAGARTLLVSAEESTEQVRLRAERLEAFAPGLWLASETDLDRVLAYADEVAPDVFVVDSIQAVHGAAASSPPGAVAQVRDCAYRLVRAAKAAARATVLVGHVTKDGTLAGPRALEHVVDTVLSFEGDRHHALRLLRALKHRFGPTNELGVFEMTDGGIGAVADAGALFLSDRRAGLPGSAVVASVEGQRPLLVELQALVAPAPPGATPRRSAQGLDAGRLALVLAVLERRAGVPVGRGRDVFAAVAGGLRVTEPAADLGLALALASSATGVALPDGLVACGEVGLGGELRQAGQMHRRLGEAARLGFTRAVVPVSAPLGPEGIELVRAATVAEALAVAGLPRLGRGTRPVRPRSGGPPFSN